MHAQKKPLFKRWWFWVIIVVLAIGIIGSLGGDDDEDKPNETQSAESASPAETASTIDSSETALQNDSIIISAVHFGDNYLTGLNERLIGMENGSVSLLDLYDFCGDILDHVYDFTSRLSDIETPASEDYNGMVRYYLYTFYDIADSLQKYIDDGEMEDLSDARELIQSLPAIQLSIISERSAYLTASGVSEEKIQELLAEEAAE